MIIPKILCKCESLLPRLKYLPLFSNFCALSFCSFLGHCILELLVHCLLKQFGSFIRGVSEQDPSVFKRANIRSVIVAFEK